MSYEATIQYTDRIHIHRIEAGSIKKIKRKMRTIF